MAKASRKEQILQALAGMLETSIQSRITTAALAAEVGVSEAALYRHFPSKARMYEGLIDFIEETLFSLGKQVLTKEGSTFERAENYCHIVLSFAEKNPGLCRIITTDALIGEAPRLRDHVQQIMDKLALQFKQIFRESALIDGEQLHMEPEVAAELIISYIEGRILIFTRSNFSNLPTSSFNQHWAAIEKGL